MGRADALRERQNRSHNRAVQTTGRLAGTGVIAGFRFNVLQVWQKPIAQGAEMLQDLDEVETNCIRIALSEGTAKVLVLMDERAGRAVPQEFGIQVAGTTAVLC
jgi:predicted nucleic acid-binding protein